MLNRRSHPFDLLEEEFDCKKKRSCLIPSFWEGFAISS